MNITADSWHDIEKGVQLLLEAAVNRVDLTIMMVKADDILLKTPKVVPVSIYKGNGDILIEIKTKI
jgi:hypothetical protein